LSLKYLERITNFDFDKVNSMANVTAHLKQRVFQIREKQITVMDFVSFTNSILHRHFIKIKDFVVVTLFTGQA
jgi:hypothetical protein